jgi:hypothetical protein
VSFNALIAVQRVFASKLVNASHWGRVDALITQAKELMKRTCLSIVFALSLISCGGNSSSVGTNTASPSQSNKSVGGIWEGTSTTNGVIVQTLALASEDGRFYAASLNTSNNCAEVGTGTVSTNGSALSGSIVGGLVYFTSNWSIQTNCTYPDGSTWGTGTLSGTVSERSSLTVTDDFTTSTGQMLPSSALTLTFNSLYNEPSSLSKIAGNWTGPTGVVTSVNSDGSFFAQDPVTGCVINGQYSIIDARYNAYAGSATYNNCHGSAAVLNGLTATGLFALNDTVVPNKLEGGASVRLSNGTVVIVVATATR